MSVDRYPVWLLVAVAVAAVVAFVVRGMKVDPAANPRRLWLRFLCVLLAAVAVLALFTRHGQRSVGLLGMTDFMASLLVLTVPFSRAARRPPVSELRQIPGPDEFTILFGRRDPGRLTALFGRHGAVVIIAMVFGTIAVLAAGEVALADHLPGASAVVACQDYYTWSVYATTGTGPQVGQGLLNQALDVAPPGPVKDSLGALVADLRLENSGDAADAAGNILSDEIALDDACQSVPATG